MDSNQGSGEASTSKRPGSGEASTSKRPKLDKGVLHYDGHQTCAGGLEDSGQHQTSPGVLDSNCSTSDPEIHANDHQSSSVNIALPDVFIMSDDKSWKEFLLSYLKQNRPHLKCTSEKDWICGRLKMENLINLTERSKLVVIGFPVKPETDYSKYAAHYVVEGMLNAKTLDSRLILVKLEGNAEIPSCFSPLTAANASDDEFLPEILKIVDGNYMKNTLFEGNVKDKLECGLTKHKNKEELVAEFSQDWSLNIEENHDSIVVSNKNDIDICIVSADKEWETEVCKMLREERSGRSKLKVISIHEFFSTLDNPRNEISDAIAVEKFLKSVHTSKKVIIGFGTKDNGYPNLIAGIVFNKIAKENKHFEQLIPVKLSPDAILAESVKYLEPLYGSLEGVVENILKSLDAHHVKLKISSKNRNSENFAKIDEILKEYVEDFKDRYNPHLNKIKGYFLEKGLTLDGITVGCILLHLSAPDAKTLQCLSDIDTRRELMEALANFLLPQSLHVEFTQEWSMKICNEENVGKDLVIPAAILARGHEAVELFKATLEEGHKTFILSKLIVMGQESMEKTCLINSLLGKKFNEKHVVTDTIAITRYCGLDRSDQNSWEEDGNIKDKYKNAIDGNAIAGNIADKLNQSGDQASTSVGDQQLVSSDEYTSSFAGEVENLWRSGTRRLDTNDMSIRIWDYGGHAVYHSMHKFITPEDIFIIVLKFTDDLNAFSVIVDSNGVKHTYHMTNLQHMLYWIRSAYTYCQKSGRVVLGLDLPPIIIVGTHLESLAETEDERHSLAKEKFDKIAKAIANTPYKSHVYPVYFGVENQLSSSDKNVGEFKKVILEIMNSMRKQIPLKWIDFLIKIQELSAERLTLPLVEVKSKARECGITDDKTIDLAIAFFSDVGEIMHHPLEDALRDTVVLQPMELVKYVKTVFTVSKPEDMDAFLLEEWSDLEKGVLKKSLLEHLWSKFPVFSDDKDEKLSDFVVRLMNKLGLICQRKPQAGNGSANSVFYAVSHIQPDPDAKVVKHDKGDDRIVVFHDFLGFLPDYFFQVVVTRFLEEFQLENASNPKLAYEYAELDIDENHSTSLEVATIKRRRMFKTIIVRKQMVDVTDVTEPAPEACKRVLEFLHSAFDALCSVEYTSKHGIQYKTCIPCGCSNDFQRMQIIDNFKMMFLTSCELQLWNMNRYRRLFGDSTESTETTSTAAHCPLEDMVLLDICNALDNNWRCLGTCLGLTKAEVDSIVMDNQEKDAMMLMLEKWRDQQPSGINQMLAMNDALKRVGYVEIADRLSGKTRHSGFLHDNVLLSVGEELGINWQKFGVHLGFNWSTIALLKSQHRYSITNACMEMLITWRERQSCEINQVDVMCKLLERAGFLEVANQLRRDEQSDGILTSNQDFYLISTVCAEWDTLAGKLDIDWKSVEDFREKCCGHEFRASMTMLTTWQTRLSSDVNQLDMMCKALNEIGRTDIAEQLTKNHAS